jgi:hypothetical protein
MHADGHASFLHFIEKPAAFSDQVFEFVELQMAVYFAFASKNKGVDAGKAFLSHFLDAVDLHNFIGFIGLLDSEPKRSRLVLCREPSDHFDGFGNNAHGFLLSIRDWS